MKFACGGASQDVACYASRDAGVTRETTTHRRDRKAEAGLGDGVSPYHGLPV